MHFAHMSIVTRVVVMVSHGSVFVFIFLFLFVCFYFIFFLFFSVSPLGFSQAMRPAEFFHQV